MDKLRNDAFWAFVLDLDSLAPTGEYVRGVWTELRYTDKAFKRLVAYGPSDLRKNLTTQEASEKGVSAFGRLGRTDLFMPSFVVRVLRDQYGFDRATARVLAGL